MKFYFYGRQERARGRGGGWMLLRRRVRGGEGMYEQTTGRRRRESPLLLISSAFRPPPPDHLPILPIFLSLSPSLFLPFHRGVSRPLACASSLALTENHARSRSRFLDCGPPYSLRPFNSIATLFYNAATRADENGSRDGSYNAC